MSIENMLHAIESGSNVEAQSIFNDVMNDKLSNALDAKRAEIADTVYNGQKVETPDEDIQDISTESE